MCICMCRCMWFYQCMLNKRKCHADICRVHQQSSYCYGSRTNSRQLQLTSQLVSAEWLSSFTWAISSLLSKAVDNSRVTVGSQQFCLTLKSLWLLLLCCLPQLERAGRISLILLFGCCAGSASQMLGWNSMSHFQHHPLHLPHLQINLCCALQCSGCVNHLLTYMCICTGTASVLEAAVWSSDRLIFLANNSHLTSSSASAASLYTWLHLFRVSRKSVHTQCCDDNHHQWFCTSRRLFDLENCICSWQPIHVLKSNACLMKGNTVCVFWYSVSGFITAYSTWQVLKNKAAVTFLSVLLPTGIADIIKLLLEQLEQWQ